LLKLEILGQNGQNFFLQNISGHNAIIVVRGLNAKS
jgi:hypothetical protein